MHTTSHAKLKSDKLNNFSAKSTPRAMSVDIQSLPVSVDNTQLSDSGPTNNKRHMH